MHRNLTLGALALSMALSAGSLMAQQQVDIGLHHNGSSLEVRVRPHAEFNGIFSAVVFSIRWDKGSGASLGELAQEGGPERYIPIIRSGDVHDVGTHNYQIFAGFGFDPLHTLGMQWRPNEEYVIATIPVNGKADFELVNDAWTGEIQNNGDYYLSLGGHDRTGAIYKSLVTADEGDNAVLIQPNPNNGAFTFSFGVPQATDLTIEVMNGLGQAVFTDVVRGFEGTYRRDMDLRHLSNGVYYLNLRRGDVKSVHKIVYR